MYFKLFESSDGEYKDKNEKTYNLIGCDNAYTPLGKNEGWKQFESLEKAVSGFGLIKFDNLENHNGLHN